MGLDSRPDGAVGLFREIGLTLIRYLHAQVVIVAVMTGIYLIGFALAGVWLWPLAALVSGLSHLIPVVGPIIGLLVPTLLVVFGDGGVYQYVGVLAVYVFAQGLEGFYLAPKVLGARLRLRPLTVFIAVLAGGLVFGPLGILLAAPAVAVFAVIWRFFRPPAQQPESRG